MFWLVTSLSESRRSMVFTAAIAARSIIVWYVFIVTGPLMLASREGLRNWRVAAAAYGGRYGATSGVSTMMSQNACHNSPKLAVFALTFSTWSVHGTRCQNSGTEPAGAALGSCAPTACGRKQT